MYLVLDNDFNRCNYPSLIGQRFVNPPTYAAVRKLPVMRNIESTISEYCTVQEEYDIDGRTAYVVADDQYAWTCWREDWDAAVAEYGDLDGIEDYAAFCHRAGYLLYDAPEAHQKIVDMGADWNWA